MSNVNFEINGKKIIAGLPEKLDITISGEVLKTIEEKIKVVNCNELIFDLKSTEFISSAGIGILLNLTRQIKGKNGKTGIINFSEQIKQVFEITDVLGYINGDGCI